MVSRTVPGAIEAEYFEQSHFLNRRNVVFVRDAIAGRERSAAMEQVRTSVATLMGAPAGESRSRTSVGTVNSAAAMTVPKAVAFLNRVGGLRKQQHLQALRNHRVKRVRDIKGLEILTPDDPARHATVTSFRRSKMRDYAEAQRMARLLVEKHHILTMARRSERRRVRGRDPPRGCLPSPTRVHRSSIVSKMLNRPATDEVVAQLLFAKASALRVAAWASLPALAGVAMLLAPGRLFSREMTWDLLYNLAGAWHLHNGHVAHVDFHTPLGALTFELTRIGFAIAGVVPRAALAGPLILVGPALAAGALAAARRLPLLPAVVFTVYVTLLLLMPANVGDHPNAYSLAMAYNRWGWSALTILCLMLFVPPRPDDERPWLDPLIGGALLLFLFSLKVTYAVAGYGAVAAALVLMPHVRRNWLRWVGATGATIANAVLPHNHAYLTDVWTAAASGHARVDPAHQILSFVANRGEFAINGVAVLCLVWLWQRGRTGRANVAASLVLLAIGVGVLSQNAQAGDMPVTLVSFFLICRLLWREHEDTMTVGSSHAATVMLAVLVWPMLAVTAEAATLSAYYRAARRDDRIVEATQTNLRGLAVPADARDLEETLAASPYRVRSPLRDPPLRDPLTQEQYLRSLLEAATLFAADATPSRVFVLDQVNAMPFVLGYPPPRGGVLWLLPEQRPRRAEDVFGDVDVVLVPKYSTLARSTVFALGTYGDYLSQAFPSRQDTDGWTVLRRIRPIDRQ